MSDRLGRKGLQELANACTDKTAFAKKLGYTYYNGKVSKKIDELVSEYNLSIAHFDPTLKNKARRKYPKVIKNCPVCGSEFETLSGDPKEKTTCSYSCANVFFTAQKHTEESNKKRASKLTKNPHLYVKVCQFCFVEFKTKFARQKYCSQSCSAKANWSNPEYKESIVDGLKQRVENGTHKGWQSRSKLNSSFPEKITIEILNELSIEFEREKKIGKWFIDFALPNNVAIEIDGKQHEYKDRQLSDIEKDACLTSNGWIVHRIKWKQLTKETRQELKAKLTDIINTKKE